MSEVTTAEFDPFTLAAPDEETELGALAASLRLAKSFSLLFARCNQPDQRRRLVASLRERLSGLNIQEIEFREPITHLLNELRFQMTDPAPDAVFVYGLEYSLPGTAQMENAPLTVTLNHSRNSFGRYIPCPLVLWVPEYVLTALMNGAPDFFSVRSGVYFFVVNKDEVSKMLKPLSADSQKTVTNLLASEKQERILNLERLLQDYKLLGSNQRDYNTEARLLDQLGNLYSSVSSWMDAERCYKEVRHIAQAIGNLKEESTALLNLGSLYAIQGRWSLAEDCYTRSFEMRQQFEDVVGQAQVLANIGNLYYVQKRFPEAATIYIRSLEMLLPFGAKTVGWQSYNNIGNAYIAQNQWYQALLNYNLALSTSRENKDTYGEAVTLSNIAGVYSGLEQWEQAEGCCHQSLTILQKIGDSSQTSRVMENLGQIYLSQGKWNEAIESFKSSLQMRRKLGDGAGEGHTLHSLALLHMHQGDLDKALQFVQDAIAVLSKTEDKNEYKNVLRTQAEIQQRCAAPK